jgi:hypothetical protein
VKSKEDEEFFAHPTQGKKVVKRFIASHEAHITIEEEFNGLILTTKVSTFQLLFATFQKKFPFIEIYLILVQGGH